MPRRRGDIDLRSASARRPWYARARALFSSLSDLRSRRKPPARSRLGVLALEDRVYPSITPLGEFAAATTTANDQQHPAIAADGSGNFVISWEGPRPEGGNGIYWQRFDISGTPQGGEFRANENPWS